MDNSKYKNRPAARLLKTIGEDLIKDVYAAIVELVKNSYDACCGQAQPDTLLSTLFKFNRRRVAQRRMQAT